LTLAEIAQGQTVDDIRAVTGCAFKVADILAFMDDLDDKSVQDVTTERVVEPIHENLVAALA
jgi:hypothetical protein